MSAAASPYLTVTEQPGQLASREQLAMMAARYAWAASYAAGCDVLEVACGSGTGIGFLAEVARQVAAGDIDNANLHAARKTYAGHPRIDIRRMNAMSLTSIDRSRDLVLLFEAIYYLSDARCFFREAHRVLRPGGRLLIATANCEWDGFNPSPLHTRYWSASELREALQEHGFGVQIHAGFPAETGVLHACVGFLRRAAVSLGLVPKTMTGKAFLKRIFYGPLRPIPGRIDPREFAHATLTKVQVDTNLARYKVLYVAAQKD
jgi:SAM-dependent methyltransferase